MERILPKAARYEFLAQRDEAGVPHVQASSWRHAPYALGYLHALDRPTQLYFARAIASGVASERIANKPELLEMDLFLRRAGIHRHLAKESQRLPPGILQQIEWYCRGVNDGMLESASAWLGPTLPMWVTGFRPMPWDVESVMLIGNLLSFAGLAVGEQEAERQMLELIQLGMGDDRLRELFSPYLDGIDFEPLRDIHVAKRLSDDALELLSDLPRLAGSNAWAVSPARSASGGALLAADPHLEVNRLPAIWYEAVLSWADSPEHERHYAMGATLPGCPLMAVGRTRRLSWGVTYMHADTSDYFIEDCRPGGETGWQYRRGEDQWHDFELRKETLRPKGAYPIELGVLENELGTMTSTPTEPSPPTRSSWTCWRTNRHDDLDPTEPASTSRRAGSAARRGGAAIATWLDVIAANTAAEAMEVVRDSPHPSLVWVFADHKGHIGSQASGWHPRRKPGNAGFVPMPAWDEANHWLGVVPSELLPREYDPPIGFVASANEELYRKDGPPLHAFGLADYRKRRIVQRLTELPHATFEDMIALQYDVVSLQADDLLPVLLAHVGDCPLKRQLENWDRRYNLDSTEATLFMHFYRHVLLEVFGHEQGIGWRRMFYLTTRMGFSRMVLTAADRGLRRVTSSWWRDRDKGELDPPRGGARRRRSSNSPGPRSTGSTS